MIRVKDDLYIMKRINGGSELSWNAYENIQSSKTQLIPKAKPSFASRIFFHMTNYDDRTVFLTGGMLLVSGIINLNETHLYYSLSDSWVKGPNMLAPRIQHSSCVMGDCVYVMGGSN